MIEKSKIQKTVCSIFAVTFLLFFVINNIEAGEPGETGSLIMGYLNKGISVFNDPELKDNEKEQKVKLWSEISPIFNFNAMCKNALGKKWGELEDNKRIEFSELFTEVLKNGYIGKTNSYSTEKIIYLSEIADNKRAKVQTSFVDESGLKLAVNFRLIKENNRWEIYDIIIDGVSFISNYRSQFNKMLSKFSVDELISDMQKRFSIN